MILKATLQLLRPANLVTAAADILAGMCIVNYAWDDLSFLYLVFASVCLYAGGVVLNDYFDRDIDAKERPERPIPSGAVSKQMALILGVTFLLFGVFLAYFYHWNSFLVSIGICFFVLLYDQYAKHHFLLGPLVMGICRGLNLILGMTVVIPIPEPFIFYALLPVVYIAAITLISQNEVLGGGKSKFIFALILFGIVLGIQLFVAYQKGYFFLTIPFVSLHSILLFPPLFFAIRNPLPMNIRKAVKMGVLTLIVLNVSFAASFGMGLVAIIILSLLPISLGLSKVFAVT